MAFSEGGNHEKYCGEFSAYGICRGNTGRCRGNSNVARGTCIFSDDANNVNDSLCYVVREVRQDPVKGAFGDTGFIPGGPPPLPKPNDNPPPPLPGGSIPPIPFPGPGGVGIDLNTILNYFERIWNILERARPVVTVDRPPYATALPQGVQWWTDMEWPSEPRAVLYRFSAKNYFGIEVGRFNYVISYVYNGRYQGIGRYLFNITVYASEGSAKPGFTLDARAEVPNVYNAGTKENPIAAAQIFVTAHLKSIMSDLTQTRSYVIKGDGQYSETVPIGLLNFSPQNWK